MIFIIFFEKLALFHFFNYSLFFHLNSEILFLLESNTTHNPQKVRNDEFLRSIVQNVNEKNHEEEEKEGLLEECEEDPLYNM